MSRLHFFTSECEVIPRSSRSMTFRIVSVGFAHCVDIESAIETGDTGKKRDSALGVGRPTRHIGSVVRAVENLICEKEFRECLGGIMILRWDGGLRKRVMEVCFQTLK
jgi:hypothetical protein